MKSFIIILMLFLPACVFAQRDIDKRTPWSFKDRYYLGFGLGNLGFGANSITLGASPMLGYMLVRNLSAGVALEYQYTRNFSNRVDEHLYGGYPFLRYNIDRFFIQTDYDMFKYRSDFIKNDPNVYDRFFVGVGYTSQSSDRAASHFLVSYDVKYTSGGVFGSPLNIRIFFTFH